MKLIDVKTGFGYIVDKTTGFIREKVKLEIRKHSVDDNIDYIEVADQNALDAVIVDPSFVIKQDIDLKILKRMRELAIADLISNSEIPADYTE